MKAARDAPLRVLGIDGANLIRPFSREQETFLHAHAGMPPEATEGRMGQEALGWFGP